MDTVDYIKKYEEELKDEKKYSLIFNAWAFIFSSLYFYYKRMYGHFFIFFVAPIILTGIFTPLVGEGGGLLTSLLIMHLVAGFVANPHYKKYMQNYVINHKEVDTSKVVSYDSMSITKLILCMVFSLGLYSLYWGYKHWKKYQMTTKDDVSPLARGWFIHFTAPSLFSKIRKSINSNIKLQYLGVGYLVCSITSALINRYVDKTENTVIIYSLSLILLILFAISILFFVVVQKKINEYNVSHTNEKIKITINIREIIIVIIGFILLGVMPFTEGHKNTHYPFEEYTPEQQEKIGASVGFIYRHTKGYKEVCQKEGYMMTKYPNDFSQYFSKEINELKDNLSKHNYTIEYVENILLGVNDFKTTLITSIYAELENLGKLTIISAAAEEQGIPIEDVKWNSEWDNLLTFKDICEILDDGGIELIKEGESKYFLKANSL